MQDHGVNGMAPLHVSQSHHVMQQCDHALLMAQGANLSFVTQNQGKVDSNCNHLSQGMAQNKCPFQLPLRVDACCPMEIKIDDDFSWRIDVFVLPTEPQHQGFV